MKVQSKKEETMARTKKQNDEMREVRLKQIRKEALRQFSMNGLTTTKIKDIAIGVNMSQGLIYHLSLIHI